jgi:response regulator RpfG family c-di-GMP phosphodiesterase
MATILCFDDFTSGLSGVVDKLREHGYRVFAADDTTAALEIAAHTPIDAVILNCRKETDNTGIVVALRILQPDMAVIMYSGYCGVPCTQSQLADACVEKGGTTATLLNTLQAVLCQAKYGFCRSVAS